MGGLPRWRNVGKGWDRAFVVIFDTFEGAIVTET
jgi:hypothetical protein